MTIYRRLAIVLLTALLALPAVATAQPVGNIVTGTINYLDRSALPAGSVVTIQLADISRPGAPGVIIAEQRIATSGQQPPIPFTLPYDPGRIQATGIYSLQGNIVVGGQLRYSSSQVYRVITGGTPSRNITMTLARVGMPAGSSGNGTLLLAGLLGLAALGVALTRRWLKKAEG